MSIPFATIPRRREPIPEGASGLHFPADRIYANSLQRMSSDICQGATASVDQIDDVMPGSLSTTMDTAGIQSYAQGLVTSGKIPGGQGSADEQLRADQVFDSQVKAEYCFYEARYITALRQFVATAADSNGTVAAPVLQTTVNLNRRLNSLLEIINYVSNERSRRINDRSSEITAANTALQDKIKALADQQRFLESSDVRIRTQEEMVRYSAEKSRGMNIQIMFFVALNVVALGTIFTVYSSMGPPRT
jgi:hypothetical protein